MVTLSKDPQGSLVKNREERLDDLAIQIGNAWTESFRHRIGCLDCWAKIHGGWALHYSGELYTCEKGHELEKAADAVFEKVGGQAWNLMEDDREQFIRTALLAQLTAKASVDDLERLVKAPAAELQAFLYPPPPPKPAPAAPVAAPAADLAPAPVAEAPKEEDVPF